ncbi:MAG: hypothetical protein A7316_05275 [Candidatus Altiarchaeales archaeon WOR_SM1_86-2]|nr:MAG: hypothetical protein A7315_04845 [Candidatus Altiarchaeales archaeon WOR_SM1_79]ODS39521.1 MAG: hypothetical protein A7316_05275 [Candidatus Altiarchaeales archaeon WOR_SM1_86-2]
MIVSNSTPLIALSRINRLGLLKEYFTGIYIPREVYREVVEYGGDLAGAKEVKDAGWIKIGKTKDNLGVEILMRSVDRGEAEAIILGKENNADLLLIDDKEGREIAEGLGVKISGTLGVLLLAAKDNKINLKDSLDNLIASGFRLSKEEYDKLVRGAAEGHR